MNEIVVYVKPTYHPDGLSFDVVYPDGSYYSFHVTAYELRARRCSSMDFIESTVTDQYESKFGRTLAAEVSIF